MKLELNLYDPLWLESPSNEDMIKKTLKFKYKEDI